MGGLELKTRRPQPRVVMLVANNFQHDTRVYKEARSLIEWGCDVHVIALYDPELPVNEEVDGIRVRSIRMRRDDLWRLAALILSWWCRPILRRVLGPVRGSATRSPTTESTAAGSTKLRWSFALYSQTEIVFGGPLAKNETVFDARDLPPGRSRGSCRLNAPRAAGLCCSSRSIRAATATSSVPRGPAVDCSSYAVIRRLVQEPGSILTTPAGHESSVHPIRDRC